MTVKIETMESIPARSNPFCYDHVRMGVQVNDRFVVMYNDHTGNSGEVVVVDIFTGVRKRMVFSPPAEKTRNQKIVDRLHESGIASWKGDGIININV